MKNEKVFSERRTEPAGALRELKNGRGKERRRSITSV
jgi:hypothetical protein